MSVANEELWDLLEVAAKNATGTDDTDITDFILILEDEWITDVEGLQKLKPETLDELLPLLLSQELQRLVRKAEDDQNSKRRRWRRGPPKTKRSRSRRNKSMIWNRQPDPPPEMTVIDEETSLDISDGSSSPGTTPVGDDAHPEVPLVGEGTAPDPDPTPAPDPDPTPAPVTALVRKVTAPEIPPVGEDIAPEKYLFCGETDREVSLICNQSLDEVILMGKEELPSLPSMSSLFENREKTCGSNLSKSLLPAPHEEPVVLETIDKKKCSSSSRDISSSTQKQKSRAAQEALSRTAIEDDNFISSSPTQKQKPQSTSNPKAVARTTIGDSKCTSNYGPVRNCTSQPSPKAADPASANTKKYSSTRGHSLPSKPKLKKSPKGAAPTTMMVKKCSLNSGGVGSSFNRISSQPHPKEVDPATMKVEKCTSNVSVKTKQMSRTSPETASLATTRVEKCSSNGGDSSSHMRRSQPHPKAASPATAKVEICSSSAGGSVTPQQEPQTSPIPAKLGTAMGLKSSSSYGSVRECNSEPAPRASALTTRKGEQCSGGIKDEIRDDPPGMTPLTEEESSSSSSSSSSGNREEPPNQNSQVTAKTVTPATTEDSKSCIFKKKKGSFFFKMFDLVDNICSSHSCVEHAEKPIECCDGEGIDDDDIQRMSNDNPLVTDPDERAKHRIADAAREAKVIANAKKKFLTREALEDAIEHLEARLEAEEEEKEAAKSASTTVGKKSIFDKMDKTKEIVSPAEYELRELYPLRLILPTVGDLMEMIVLLQPRRIRAIRELDMKSADALQGEIEELQRLIDEEERYLLRRRMGEVECLACGEKFIPESEKMRIIMGSGSEGGSVVSANSGGSTGKAKERHCEKCRKIFGSLCDKKPPTTWRTDLGTANDAKNKRNTEDPSAVSSHRTWYLM